MHRSYLLVKENDFKILSDENILKADSIILDINEASSIFVNFSKYEDLFKDFKNRKIDVFVKIDFNNKKDAYKKLDFLNGEYIKGFYLVNYTINNLRSFNLKVREFEKNKKLYFKSLIFICKINSVHQANRLKNIFNNPRLKYISLDRVDGIDNDYLKDKVVRFSNDYRINFIENDKIVNEINKLDVANEKYNLLKEDVEKAKGLLEEFSKATKDVRKDLLQSNSLERSYQVLELAKKIDMIDAYPVVYYRLKKKKETVLKKEIKINKFYTLGEEIANSVSHGIGILLSFLALVLLIIKGGSKLELFSYIVFAISGIILYTMSTLYHALKLGDRPKLLFQKFDHMTIYILIAGTYTPFSLMAIGGSLGVKVCIFLWCGALFGLLLNLFAFGKFRFLHMFLYVALGWVAVLFMPSIVSSISRDGVILLFLGGLMYTIGIFFYALKLFKFTHMVWHIFTLLGTLLHFITILLYL